ncbi:copper-sensing transcriptional repressor CsoR [Fervidicella metallireducens AeB]|uniref:Copper-sensing transcriptional repressor CsoR n=1 Tax=Fervidicella metallireducens AeB TaxID=1403537 RepID=A0A017S0E4_9CLOT|nr:metal-sensitive transcriptional regulator [Fervidicella metallireducens]EYE89640.1 copper-sensing transcriptional repressor CsoR [Fervidicella metallireducens AeB]
MDKTKEDIIKRLRRIEGQVKGIERMIEKDQCCNDILIQIAAVKAAISKVGGLVLENYSRSCIKKAIENDESEENIENMIETIIKFIK